MTVNQAVDFFENVPPLKRKLATLQEVGLGYIKLGQPATTLSGGEAQRVKLASELCRIPRGHTMYILDEPTTGLHLADVDQLLKVLFKLSTPVNLLSNKFSCLALMIRVPPFRTYSRKAFDISG